MSELVTSTSVVSSGLALFTDDNARANVKAITGVYLQIFQDIEAAIWATYQSRQVDLAVGVQLDLLGALVGQARGNLGDVDYRSLIRTRILVNRSDGSSQAMTDIMASMIRGTSVTGAYADTGDFHFQISFFDLFSHFTADVFEAWVVMIRQAKALGSTFDAAYSTTTTAGSFVWDTVSGGYVDSKWDDVVDTLAAGKWAAVG